MSQAIDQQEGLSRRNLIVAGLSAAGGLAVCMTIPAQAQAATPAMACGPDLSSPDLPNPKELSAWLIIDPDNTVTVRVSHAEMGQGTATALAMILAEELECDWSKVRCEYASANRSLREKGVYKSMQTVGSQGVRSSWQFMQQAGASARVRLIEAGARRWGVAASECEAAAGKVVHKASGRSLDYGALAPAAAAVTLAAEPAIKTPDKYKLIGKATPRLDTRAKIDGSAKFGIDTRLPGMVYAAVSACPVFGGTLKDVDESGVKGRRGIIAVVRMKDSVAVVADNFWRAKSAVELLKITWDTGPSGAVDSAQLRKAYLDAMDGPTSPALNKGDAATALAAPGASLVEAVYEVPYLSHAPMEPLNATVDLRADRLDVWIGSQAPPQALQLAATASGLSPEKVYIHNCFLGGGFGRRTQHDELEQAIAVAKVVRRPVKLVWTREQDILRDRFRPQAAVRFKAALDGAGKPTALDSRVAVGSLFKSLGIPFPPGAVEPMAVEVIATHAYKIPNQHVGAVLKNAHVPVMFWRSVGASQNTFFVESFIDEMAHAAGQDPYKFRRAMLDRPDYLGVLDTMAAKSGWGETLPAGRGRGMAIVDTYGTVTGQVVDVTVSPQGEVKVDRVVAVVDCYHAVNPNTIAQQIEGGVVYGLSAAMWGEITIKDGAAQEINFDTYRLVRMAETPKIEVHLVPSGGSKWGGIGEPSVAPIAPALCNAIFAATGKRVRQLPLKNIDLKTA